MNEKTFADNFFFYLDVFLSHFFSLLSAFLSSKPFRKNYTHCEVTDATFVDIQLQKENLKNIFWAPEFGRPNWYTSLLNGQDTSLF